MPSTLPRTLLVAALGLSITTAPALAVPVAQSGSQAQRVDNARAVADLRARLAATEKRIADGLHGGKITRARATTLRQQVGDTRTSMERLGRQQGFVSAAELASYNRTLGMIDVALDRNGVARSYGNDMLTGPNPGSQAAGLRYNCQNDPVAIAIPGDRLERALAQLRLTTRCPISGTELARGKRSQPVVGTMTPTQALQAMLNGTGLQMQTIKGGFQVVRLPR